MSKIDLNKIRSAFPAMMNHQFIELIRELRKKPPTDYVPFQVCPKCDGEGFIALSNLTLARGTCDVCGGNKIIPMHPIESRKGKNEN